MKSKAIFLLVIFLLNTVVGFGCALGMDEGRHNEGNSHSEFAHHVHKTDNHHHSHSHKQQTTPVSGQNFSKEDPCCKSLVNDLVTQNKLIPESGKVQVVLPIMWLPDYFYALLIPVTDLELGQSVYVEHRERPPNEDIRIVIQSFQI